MIFEFLNKILIFILFVSTVYILLIIVSGLFLPEELTTNLNYRIGSNGHMFSRTKEIDKHKNIDILFLGSSHAYRGFDTRIFKENGLSSFNLGSSSQTPIQTNVLLERHIKEINPKIVIYDVYPDAMESDGVESSVDIIANSRNDFLSINMAYKINNIKTYNTLLYGFFRDIMNLNSDFVEEKIKEDDLYINGGFVERKSISKSLSIAEEEERNWVTNKSQIIAFEDNLEILKRNNTKVILVQTPYLNYDKYLNNDSINRYYNKLGIPYYNFNEILDLSNDYYYDYSHLNQQGVEIFNYKLISILIEKEQL